MTLALYSVWSGPGRSDTAILLAPGDTISYSVLGIADLDTVSVIDLTGQLQLPLAGRIDAAGLTIEQLRQSVASKASQTPFRTVAADGTEIWRPISAEMLFVHVAAYRPVYLMGDVRTNGEQPYRPGITLRQAIARAGGLGRPLDTQVSDVEQLSLSVERDILAGDVDFVNATLLRLESDLAAIGDQGSDRGSNVLARDDAASRWLSARNLERQLASNTSMLQAEQMQNRLEVLQELSRTQRINLEIEEAALERARTLVERGLTPASNVTDARRGVLQVSMQVLETSGEIHSLQLDLARTSDEFERLKFAQRVELLDQIVIQKQTLETMKKRLSALDQRIFMLGGQSHMPDAEPTYRYEIQRTGKTTIQLDDLSDIELLPGDVVEVSAIFGNRTAAIATQ
ncbi:MAG: polysaccharide biosynthesis/export family protein [Pseudomonadota bacterium]